MARDCSGAHIDVPEHVLVEAGQAGDHRSLVHCLMDVDSSGSPCHGSGLLPSLQQKRRPPCGADSCLSITAPVITSFSVHQIQHVCYFFWMIFFLLCIKTCTLLSKCTTYNSKVLL